MDRHRHRRARGDRRGRPAAAPVRRDLARTAAGAASWPSRWPASPTSPWRLFGTPTSSRLELARIETGLTLIFDDDPAAVLHVALTGGRLVVVAGDALSRVILGAEQIEVPFDLDARWSSASGFTIGGAVGLVFVIPVDRTLGIVTLRSIELSIGICSQRQPRARRRRGARRCARPVHADRRGPRPRGLAGRRAGRRRHDRPVRRRGRVHAALADRARARRARSCSGGGFIDLDPANGRYSGARQPRLPGDRHRRDRRRRHAAARRPRRVGAVRQPVGALPRPPARVRVHAARTRRHPRPQPLDRRRGAGRRPARGRRRRAAVPGRPGPRRRADPLARSTSTSRCTDGNTVIGPVVADRLGHADADHRRSSASCSRCRRA